MMRRGLHYDMLLEMNNRDGQSQVAHSLYRSRLIKDEILGVTNHY